MWKMTYVNYSSAFLLSPVHSFVEKAFSFFIVYFVLYVEMRERDTRRTVEE